MIPIAQYMDPRLVTFVDLSSREDVIKALVELFDRAGKLEDKQKFYQAIIEREAVISTGIGMGVAVPHAKLSDFADFYIAIAICKRGIEWNALDNAPVRLVFMIGGPDSKQTEYLQLLSNLTLAIKDDERRKKMLTLTSPEEIIRLFLDEHP